MAQPVGDGITDDAPAIQAEIDAAWAAKRLRKTLRVAWEHLEEARRRLDRSMDNARQAALAALGAGMTEVEVARELGVNRMTVRKWQGK